MATSAYARALLGGVQSDLKVALGRVMDYLLDGNLALGPVAHHTRLTNFKAIYVSSTTASSTGEFTVAHGLGTRPFTALPVLDLQTQGATLPRLEVTQPADASRLYLKSQDTNVPFTLAVEG